jgi:DNA-binding MarR family transcriptional regulator
MNNDAAVFLDCRDCLCQASRSAARSVTTVYDQYLRPHGLRITQFTILSNLILRGATSMTTLAKFLGVDRTTLTRNIALLAENGWVRTKLDDDDARLHLVTITDQGRAVAQRALPAWREAQSNVAAAFGATGVAALHRLANTKMN